MQGEDLTYVVQNLMARLQDLESKLAVDEAAISTSKLRQAERVAISLTTATTSPSDSTFHTITAAKTGWGLWTVALAAKCASAAVNTVSHMLYTNSATFVGGNAYQTAPTPPFNLLANTYGILDSISLIFPTVANGSYVLTHRYSWTNNTFALTSDGTSGVMLFES
jgi:hypothetical protein